ncbi:MAG TPA: hypothetical protein VM368_05830, partial [Flavisolibacter sp.]|nr:hypothetical protein [Flavisolibacter sp.]
MQPDVINHPSSYRDPSGFLFYHNDVLYRQVNKLFKDDFDAFITSGLYDHLVQKELLVPHQTIGTNLTGSGDWYQTIQPEKVPFISYPYEWCFEMWKDAALTTLQVAKEALQFGMMLKDASAYNVQLYKGKMHFIDTLSFEKYNEQEPWIAYRQFCEHFLAPLALMHYLQQPLQTLFIPYPNGVPLAVAKKMLPFKSKWNLHTYLHLHVHASVANRKGKQQQSRADFSKQKLSNLLSSLELAVRSYSFQQPSGVWSEYYEEANQREDYVIQKKQIIKDWVKELAPKSGIDIGANEGEFSEILAEQNIYTISADFDHYSINKFYRKIKSNETTNIHPLIIDLVNPSPAIGLNNEERSSFISRVQTDLVVALALVHHLAIGKNMPFKSIVQFFKSLGTKLIVEY